MRVRITLWAVLVALPLLGLLLLLWQPALDVRWEHQPTHFWLVLGAALVTGILPDIASLVNLASRLEGQAKAGQVVVGAETYRALPDGTRVQPLSGVRVKGKQAPIEAYVVFELPPSADG